MKRILLEIDYEGKTYYLSNTAYSGNLVYYPFLISIPQIGIGGDGFAKVTTGQVVLSLNVDDPAHPFSGARYYSLISSVQEIPFRIYLDEEDAPIFVGNIALSEVTEEEIRFLVIEEKFETELVHPVLERDSRVEVENFYLFQPAGVTDVADWQIMISAVNISLEDQAEVIIERFEASASLALLKDAFQGLIYNKDKKNTYLVAAGSALNKRALLADNEDQSKIITVRDLGDDPEKILELMGYTVTTTTSGSDTIYQVNSTALTSSYNYTVDSVLIYNFTDLIGTDTSYSIHKPPVQPTNTYGIGPPVNNPFTFGNVTLRTPVIPYGDARIKRDNQSFSAAGTGSFEPVSITGSTKVEPNHKFYDEDAGQEGSPASGGGTETTYTTDYLGIVRHDYIGPEEFYNLNTSTWERWDYNWNKVPFNKVRFKIRVGFSSVVTIDRYTNALFDGTWYGEDSTWPTIVGGTWNVLNLGDANYIAQQDFKGKAKWIPAGTTTTSDIWTWTSESSGLTGEKFNTIGYWQAGFKWPTAWSETGLYDENESFFYRRRNLSGETRIACRVKNVLFISDDYSNDHLNNWSKYNNPLYYWGNSVVVRKRRFQRDPENVGAILENYNSHYTYDSDFTTVTGWTAADLAGTYMLQYYKNRSTGASRLMTLSELIGTGDYVRVDLVYYSYVYTSTTITYSFDGYGVSVDVDSTSDSPYWGVKWGYIYRVFRDGANVYHTWLPDNANPLTWQPSDSNYKRGFDTDYGSEGMIGWQGRDPYNSTVTSFGENSLRWYKTGSRYYNHREYTQGSSGTWLTGQDLDDISNVKISAYFKLQNEDYSALETVNGWFYKNEIYLKGVKVWEDPDFHLNKQTADLIEYTDRTIGSGNVPLSHIAGDYTKIDGFDTTTTTPDGPLYSRRQHVRLRYCFYQKFEVGFTEQEFDGVTGYGAVQLGTTYANRDVLDGTVVDGVTDSTFSYNHTYIDGDGTIWTLTKISPHVASGSLVKNKSDSGANYLSLDDYIDGTKTISLPWKGYNTTATKSLGGHWVLDEDNEHEIGYMAAVQARANPATYDASTGWYTMNNPPDADGNPRIYWNNFSVNPWYGTIQNRQWWRVTITGKRLTEHNTTIPYVPEVPYIPVTDVYKLDDLRTNIYKRAQEVYEADPDTHTGLGWSSISTRDEALGVGWSESKSMMTTGQVSEENWYDVTVGSETYWQWVPDAGSTTVGTLHLFINGNVKAAYPSSSLTWHQSKEYTNATATYLLSKGTKQTSAIGDSNQYWSVLAQNSDISGYYLSQLYIENDIVYESDYKTPIKLSSSSNIIDGTTKNIPQHLFIDAITQSPNMGTIVSDLYNLYRIDNTVSEPIPLGVIKTGDLTNKPSIFTFQRQDYQSGTIDYYSNTAWIGTWDGSQGYDWLEYDSDAESVLLTLECYGATRIHQLRFYSIDSSTGQYTEIAVTSGTYPDGTLANQVETYNRMPVPAGTQAIRFDIRNDEDLVDDWAKLTRGFDFYLEQRVYPEMGKTFVADKVYAYVFCGELVDQKMTSGGLSNSIKNGSIFMDTLKNGRSTGWPFSSASDDVDVYAIRNPNLKVGYTPLTTTDYVVANWTPRIFDDGVELGLKKEVTDPNPLSRVYIESSINSDLIYLSHNPFGQVALTGESANGVNIRDFFNYLAIKLKAEKENPENRFGLVTLYFDSQVDYSMADNDLNGVLTYNLPIYTDSEMTIFEMAEQVAANTNHQFFMEYYLSSTDSNIYRRIHVVDINKAFNQETAYKDLIPQEIVSINVEFPYPIKAFESTLSRNIPYRATLSVNFESILKEVSSTYRIDGSGIGNVQQHELFAENFDEGKTWLRRFAEIGQNPKIELEYIGVDMNVRIGHKIKFKDTLRKLDGFLVVQGIQYKFQEDSTVVSGVGKFEEIIYR